MTRGRKGRGEEEEEGWKVHATAAVLTLVVESTGSKLERGQTEI